MRARLAVAVLGSASVIAFLAVAVFPTRTILSQRHQIDQAGRRVQILDETNAALQRRVDQLGSDSAIERIAREQNNLVKPGEEAFAVLPAAGDAPQVSVPDLAPSRTASSRNFWERLRDRLSFWD